FFAPFYVGQIDGDLPIEASRSEQRRIENVGAVGSSDNDDAFLGIETVHLDEQSIKRLLALVMAAANTVSAMTADGVDFVDENDARRRFFALLEHVAYARGTDSDKHLNKVRAAD